MSTESAVPPNDATRARQQLSVADFKVMLDAGVPNDHVRQLKGRFAYRHLTPDAPDGVYFSTSTLPNYPIGYVRPAALSLP